MKCSTCNTERDTRELALGGAGDETTTRWNLCTDCWNDLFEKVINYLCHRQDELRASMPEQTRASL
jgi:hypothetical protein